MRPPRVPDLTPTSGAWAVCLALVIYFGTMALYLVWRPLAFVPNVALLLLVLWLFVDGLFEKRRRP